MMSRVLLGAMVLCTTLVVPFGDGAAPTGTPLGPVQEKLTAAPGVELVRERCLLCHNEDVVVSQHLARARWDELLDWMVETQGMAELPADVRAAILDYLEATQPPRELAVSDSPWAQPRYRPNPIW